MRNFDRKSRERETILKPYTFKNIRGQNVTADKNSA